MIRSLIFLTIISSILIQPCFSINSSIIQADLVFPRNNSVYRPTYPFPIVFALHNFGKAWHYKPTLNWRLLVWQVKSQSWALGESGRMGWAYSGTPPPADFVLGINYSRNLIGGDSPWFSLEYEFMLGPKGNECFGPGDQETTGGSNNSTSWFLTGARFFNISNATGAVPDITTGGACADPLGAFGYNGPNSTDTDCPALSWPRPNPAPCLFNVDAKLNDQVIKTMINESYCKKATWPILASNCSGQPSGSTSKGSEWSTSAVLLPLFALLFSLT